MFHFFSHHTLIQGDYNLAQIQIQQQLGRGNSHVYTAIIKGQRYAMKQIEIKDDYEYRNFLQEISFMKDLSKESEYIVKYFGYFITKMEIDQYLKHKYAFLIMQCAEMNLEHLVAQYKEMNKRFTLQNLSNFIEAILNALCQLQAKHVAHCDIKPQNILIMNTRTFQIKLCDVGSCKIVTGQNIDQATILGTLPFLAPELIKIKSKKIVSANPFKSDVFSFGLVFLYLITFKKFKSQQRIQVEESTYREIINEWMKQAKELINYDALVSQILKMSLQFQEFRRPLFQEMKQFFMIQKKKKIQSRLKQLQNLEKQEEEKLYSGKSQYSQIGYQSSPGNYINLFKSRKVEKSSTKTSINGTSFRITTNGNMFKESSKSSGSNHSPSSLGSPFIKKRSYASSTSPDNNISKNIALFQIKKLVYINQKTKDCLKAIQNPEQKTFVLEIPFFPFSSADTISLLNDCSLQVFSMFEKVYANRLYLEYEKFQGVGVSEDAPLLQFPKIRANLIESSLVGGYSGLFRIFCNSHLEILQLRITESEVTYNDVIFLLDNLEKNCPRLNTFVLCWEKNILSAEEHFQLTQKISKLPLKKLCLVMNENYIKYDKQMTWLLPKSCEILYLEYSHNLLNSIMNHLSLSISGLVHLKEVYLNFQNNNLQKGEMNMISKSLWQLKQLQKIVLDLSLNKIQDLNYLQKNLSELINLHVIEIRIHKTQTSVQRTIEFIKNLKELFQFKLQILKVSINRHLNLKILKQKIQLFCIEKGTKKIIIDVIGFDNSYFMIYLKKKPKTFNRLGKASTSVRKQKLQSIKFNNTIALATTIALGNFSSTKSNLENRSIGLMAGLCTRFFTNSDGYDNYMCLGCCQNSEMAKSVFYCKFCIEHCFHKGHNIVKVYSRTKCSCSYSGHCQSDVSQNICAQKLKILYKKQFVCMKCQKGYCLCCISTCKELHKNFVKQNKELTYFTCAGDKFNELMEY